MNKEYIIKTLEEVLNTQHYGVLSTIRDDIPHPTLVGFAVSDDLDKIVLFSPSETRKSINMKIHNKVSFIVTTASNSPDDINNARNIAAYGQVVEVDRKEKDILIEKYLTKNKHMQFFNQTGTDLVVIAIDHFNVVFSFKEVLRVDHEKGTFTISNRQIEGEQLQPGFFRGPALRLSELLKEGSRQELENFVLILDTNHTVPVNEKIKAAITLSKSYEYEDLNNLPILFTENLPDVTSGSHVTVNGDLAIITFHEIK